MSDSDTLLKLANERFGKDLYATQTTGIEIVEANVHYAKCKLQVDARHRNAMGAVMGGAIYTLADFAFAIAANMDELNTVSSASNIVFVAQPQGDTLFAEAKPVKEGNTVCHYQISVTDAAGNIVASITTTGVKIKR